MNPFCLFALVALIGSPTFVAAQDEPAAFGSAFAPTFAFSETYRETVRYSAVEEDYLDQTVASLSFKARVSMHGLDPGAITNDDSLLVDVGNLSLELPLGEGTRSVVEGTNTIRWQLEGTDPDTGDTIENACTVTLRYDATELIVQLTSSNAPDDFNIMAPDEAGTDERVEDVPLSFDFSVGLYTLGERICYVNGTSALYNTTVNGELFEDLANVKLSGELDTEKPVVKITQPKADATVGTSTVGVSGSVIDNYAVALVEVSLNGGPFIEATVEDNGIWHLADVAIAPGPNWLIARAEDESGNVDTSAVRTFEYAPRGQLAVTADGNAPGSVSAAFIARLDYSPAQAPGVVSADLVIGKEFSIVATPGADALFDHWSSNVPLTPAQAASPRLVFTMTENLALTAHFVINPFLPAQGKYAGLLLSPDSEGTGILSGKVTRQGTFSLKAKLGRLILPIKGRFSLDGHFTSYMTAGGISYVIDLTLNVTGAGTRTITGTITGGITSVTLVAELSPFRKQAHPVPAELVGSFNFLLPPGPNATDPNYPIGIGFGRVTISASGTAKFIGQLADGTPVSGSGLLSGERRWPIFNSLYRGAGSISGWVTFDRSQVDHDLSGTLDWKKPRSLDDAIHAEGFAGQSDLSGAKNSTLLPASPDSSVLSQIILRSPAYDPIPLDISFPFPLRRSGRTTVAAPPGSPIQSITCKVQAKTGLLSGTVTGLNRTWKIRGMVVGSKVNQAGGYILRNRYSTVLSIVPAATD